MVLGGIGQLFNGIEMYALFYRQWKFGYRETNTRRGRHTIIIAIYLFIFGLSKKYPH
jgi:hypothetical protein